jgi:glycosyltransferase involved in cell wall biosynthesis
LTFNSEWLMKKCIELELDYVKIPFHRFFKKTYLLPIFGFLFAGWLKRQKISILHSHLFGPITGAAFAAFLARIPHVGTLHDVYMISDKPLRIYLIKFADFIGTRLVSVSIQMNKFYSVRTSLKNIQTIYNGIDTDAYKFVELKNEGVIKILCLGRLVKLKRVDVVISAFKKLLIDYPVELHIVGDGPEMNNLKSCAKENEENIIFHGQQDQCLKYLQSSDVFVQFSTTEGLSRSIIEASSCGLPCIVSDVGGNNEIVLHEKTGYVIDSKDEDKDVLYAAMVKLVSTQGIRATFSLAAREHAKNNFSHFTCNQKYLELYNNLI